MGKRELLIIAAFILIGGVAYQLTAPPPTGDESRFSLSRVLTTFRREVGANRASASATTRGTIAITPALEEVRIAGMTAVSVTGENRHDISYALTVESTGPDEVTAQEAAARTTLLDDDLGPVLSLRPQQTRQGRQVARLTLTLPSHLKLRVEGGSAGTTVAASAVRGVQLDAVVGDTRLERVQGAITGSHRNGELRIDDAGSVTMTLVLSKATIGGVRGAVMLSARNGRCELTAPQGAVELDLSNEDVTIAQNAAFVSIGGSGGRIAISDPQQDVKVDVRRAAIDLALRRPVRVTVLTTDAPLRLQLGEPIPPITLDAASIGSTIKASAMDLATEHGETESRLHHVFGNGARVVSLRNERGEIVISRMK